MRACLLIPLVSIALYGSESDSCGDDCGGGGACQPAVPDECPTDAPTYADVQPIFEERCVVCHTDNQDDSLCPMPGQCWSLEDYDHIKDWSAEIRNVIRDCEMPLPGSGVTMTDTEREEILAWIRCGSPE